MLDPHQKAAGNKENSGRWTRVAHALRAEGVVDPDTNPLRSGIHHRGYLPHVKREGATYFVTFRLADSLPREVLARIVERRAQRLAAAAANGQSADTITRRFERIIERYLDRGAGACHLARPDIADLVAGTLQHFEGQRYHLKEWVVMPNHVHVVVWPMPNHLLSDVVKSWKQFIALRAGRRLQLPPGRFWQPEFYNHWVRDAEDHSRLAAYIRRNPVVAGLCRQPEDWRWSSAYRVT